MPENWKAVETDMPADVQEAEHRRMVHEDRLQKGRTALNAAILAWNMGTSGDLVIDKDDAPAVIAVIEDLKAQAARTHFEDLWEEPSDPNEVAKLIEQNEVLAGEVVKLREALKDAEKLREADRLDERYRSADMFDLTQQKLFRSERQVDYLIRILKFTTVGDHE